MLSSSESVSMTTSGAPQPSRRRLAPPRVRPNLYFEEGVGRKTGWRPPPNLPVDQFGFEDFDDYLKSDEEPEEEDLQIQHQKQQHQQLLHQQQQQQYPEVVQDSRPASPELNRSPAPYIKQQPLRQTPRQDNIPQPFISAKKSIQHQQQLQQQRQYQLPRNCSGSPVGSFEDPSTVFRKSTLVPRSPVSASQESPREQQEYEEEEEIQQPRPRAHNRRHSGIPTVSKSYGQQQEEQQYLRRETVAPRSAYQEQGRYYDESTSLYREKYGDEPMEFNELDNLPSHLYQQQPRQVVVASGSGSPNPQSGIQQYAQERVYRSTNPTPRATSSSSRQTAQPSVPSYQQQPKFEEDEVSYNYPDDFEDYSSRHASPANAPKTKYPQPYVGSMAASNANSAAPFRRQSMAPSSSTAPSTPAANQNQPRQRATEQARGAMTEQPTRRYSHLPQAQQQSSSRSVQKQKQQQYVPPPQPSPPLHGQEGQEEEMGKDDGIAYDSAPVNEIGQDEEEQASPAPLQPKPKPTAVDGNSTLRIAKKPTPSNQATVAPLPPPSAIVSSSFSSKKHVAVAKSAAVVVLSPVPVVGRHGRSKLSERVVTAVEEASHDEQEEEEVDVRHEEDEEEEVTRHGEVYEQELEEHEEEQHEGEEQEEGQPSSEPAYVAFPSSKDPKWSFPLLPGEPGYVAPVISSPRPTASAATSKKTRKLLPPVAASAASIAYSSPVPQPKHDKKGKTRVIHGLAGYIEGTDEAEPTVYEPEYHGSENGENDVGGGGSEEDEDDGGYAGDLDHSMAAVGGEMEIAHHEPEAQQDEQEQQHEERESEREEAAPVAKAKNARGRPTTKKRGQDGGGSYSSAPKRKRKEWGAMVPADSEAPRGKRTRLAPVEYWRGEKIVYEMKRESMGAETLVPVATKILRAAPEEDHVPSKHGHRKKSTSKGSAPVVKKEKVAPLETPEFPVLNFQTGEEETQRLVYTEDMYNPQVVGQGSSFMFQRTFSVGTFCGSGMMVLPKGSEKPNKSSGPTVLIVYVLSGRLKVTIHKSSFEVGEGSQFMIPRGNQYSMKNTGSGEVKLFFLQGKETEVVVDAPAVPAVTIDGAAAAAEPVQAAEEVAKPKSRKSTTKKDQETAAKPKKGNGSLSKAEVSVPKGKKAAKESAKNSSDDSSKKGKLSAKK
ncbi:UNVERIFIED_CONTAM: hypothetical protein HDU68_005704 [Siphonaria sp. JEL0065]|nr:hypothetical protein HDU68_005704 [Siphonaria sp. JEL0065]